MEVLQAGRQVDVVQTAVIQKVGSCPNILRVHIPTATVVVEMPQAMLALEEKPARKLQIHTFHQIHQSKRRHQSSEGFLMPQVQRGGDGFRD